MINGVNKEMLDVANMKTKLIMLQRQLKKAVSFRIAEGMRSDIASIKQELNKRNEAGI